ncbi:MAG: hypothetical protein R3B47_19975 [Bacteroidia bacterium]
MMISPDSQGKTTAKGKLVPNNFVPRKNYSERRWRSRIFAEYYVYIVDNLNGRPGKIETWIHGPVVVVSVDKMEQEWVKAITKNQVFQRQHMLAFLAAFQSG